VTFLRAAAEERRELAKAAARAGAPVQAALMPPGVVKSPPPRRHNPLLGLLAQPPLRLVDSEAVHVHMLAYRAQLELCAQLLALQVAVRHWQSRYDSTAVRRYTGSCASSAAGPSLSLTRSTRVMGGGAVAPM
jgi:hypothetical protein